MKTVLSQNYFTFSDNIYQLLYGIAMGSPISSIINEIYLCYENMFIKHILEMTNIIFYTRYVYDTFIIYNKTTINPDLITTNMNHIHKDIIF
jgi:hypothetical protein